MKKYILINLVFFKLQLFSQFNWNQIGTDVQGQNIYDQFGHRVTISASGNIVIASSMWNQINNFRGYIKAFSWNNNNWSDLGSPILGTIDNSQFGYNLDINNDGSKLISHTISSNFIDVAKVYQFDGSNWVQLGTNILGGGSRDINNVRMSGLGDRVSLALGDYIDPGGFYQDSGYIKVLEFNGTNWFQIGQEIFGGNGGVNLGDLNSSGNIIAVSNSSYDGNSLNSLDNRGCVKVYQFDGSSWIQLGQTIEGSTGDQLGHYFKSVSLNYLGDRLSVASNSLIGSPYTRVYDYNGLNWVQIGSDINEKTTALSLDSLGDILVVSHPYDSYGFTKSFKWNGTDWIQIAQTLYGDSLNSKFGWDVSINNKGNRFITGEIANNLNGDFTGSFKVYELDCPTVTGDTTSISDCDSTEWLGNIYSLSGIYNDTLVSSVGCDSVVTMDLTIYNSVATTDNLLSCDSAVWNGNIYDASGIYVDTLQTINGCDSVVTMTLTINNSTQSSVSLISCDSLVWNGTTYTTTGQYVDTLQTTSGCDSVVTLSLSVSDSYQIIENITSCDSYNWNGLVYSATGQYVDSLQSVTGCDSVRVLNLIINQSTSNLSTISSCNYYVWNNDTLNSSGTYVDTSTNTSGCIHLDSLILTINGTGNSTYQT